MSKTYFHSICAFYDAAFLAVQFFRSSPSHVVINAWGERQTVRTDSRSENFNKSLDEIQSIPEPPPISRHSRAFKHFQNPPQPHMCIRQHTADGEELFINVMSWTRIVMPQNADEPIPLYGGMRASISFLTNLAFTAQTIYFTLFLKI